MKLQASNVSSEMSIQDWIITVLLTLLIPVGIIMLFIWVSDTSTNPAKAKYAKTVLFIYGLLLTIYVSYFVFFGLAIFNSMSSL